MKRDLLDAAGLLARLAAQQPVMATALGIHAHDGAWPDLSLAGGERLLAWLDTERARLEAVPLSDLSRDDLADRDLALATLAALSFEHREVRPAAWDPMHAVAVVGGGLFPLISRTFGTAESRATALSSRLRGVGDLLDAAVDALVGVPELDVSADDGAPRLAGATAPTGRVRLPARPVSRLHLDTAIAQASGIRELAQRAVEVYGAPLEAAAAAAGAAADRFAERLRSEVAPRATGEGRYGAPLYDRALRHTLFGSHDRAAIARAATREFAATRERMIEIARAIAPTWIGAERAATLRGNDHELVAATLDAIGAEHSAAADLLDRCREETAACEAFIRRTGLVELPAEPLEIMWTPRFLRAYGGAFLDAPGPLDRGEKSFFYVTPPPDDATPEQVESMLREDNDRMLKLLAIHEAIPGHYLQLAAANESDRPLRAAFGSGVFAEGWAVYVTQVMLDEGFGDGDQALELVHWKFYLRCVANALLDVGIHADGRDEAWALDLMVGKSWQEESEARAKYLRARLGATQLPTYFVGSMGCWEVEDRARTVAALAAGAPAPVAGALPGRRPATPGFSRPAHLRAMLRHGTPPIPLLERLMGLTEATRI
ncbi:MAG: DUF885 domain-containing protein [Candidatus Limnocylindrus sp.]